MMVKFKNFEIRPTTYLDRHKEPLHFEVVKWYKNEPPIKVKDLETGKTKMVDTSCYTVAHIYWNKKEPCWEFKSVGLRFIEDYEEGLCEFIKKFIELLDIVRRAENAPED